MVEIRVSIDKIVDCSSYPGLVECSLYDAWNEKHTFIDKILVFADLDYIISGSNSSDLSIQAGGIRGEKIKDWLDETGRKILTVSTELPDHVESTDSLTEFEVLENQVSDFVK